MADNKKQKETGLTTLTRRWQASRSMPFHIKGLHIKGEPAPLRLYAFTDEQVDAFIKKYPGRAHYWEQRKGADPAPAVAEH
jgi:hypothetical protein